MNEYIPKQDKPEPNELEKNKINLETEGYMEKIAGIAFERCKS